jgi:hypothetical protein
MTTITALRRWLAVIVGCVATVATGCGGAANAPVEPAAARETLQAALDSWKRGDRPDALQGASPPIFVIDQEWQDGTTLKDYKLAGDGEAKDANLYCPVVLTVRSRGGAEVTRTVTYIVSTAPNRTVSRKVF